MYKKDNAIWNKSFDFAVYINESEFVSIYNDCEELLKLLVSITKTIKTNLKTKISNS